MYGNELSSLRYVYVYSTAKVFCSKIRLSLTKQIYNKYVHVPKDYNFCRSHNSSCRSPWPTTPQPSPFLCACQPSQSKQLPASMDAFHATLRLSPTSKYSLRYTSQLPVLLFHYSCAYIIILQHLVCDSTYVQFCYICT